MTAIVYIIYLTRLETMVWHDIFAGSNFREFRGFSNDPRKLDTAKKLTPAKK